MIVPALSTLLSQPALQMLGHYCPLFVAVEIHKLYNLRNEGYASELHLDHTGYTKLSESNFKPLQSKSKDIMTLVKLKVHHTNST